MEKGDAAMKAEHVLSGYKWLISYFYETLANQNNSLVCIW
jgi:hypothetical protein